jgi:formylglycine-generating enzyme required for sulfatase activity
MGGGPPLAIRPSSRHDLFISHATADAWWVKGFLLPALGLPADRFITPEQFRPGAVVLDEFEQAVRQSRLTVIVLSPAYLADQWAIIGEQLASHAAVAEARDRLVPLLLEPCRIPLHVDFRVRLDCTDPATWEVEVARLRELLDRPEPRPEKLPCPYPGMVPFGDEDGGRFFGRNREVQELVGRIRATPRLFIIGPSGSGKSSLVFAGLVPELHRREPGRWLVRSLRPGQAPLAALASALEGQPTPSQRLLVVVDQLEEVFTQPPAAERESFLAVLKELHQMTGGVVLMTMRADFYGDLMGTELWPLPDGKRLEVVPLRGDALRAAIKEPARTIEVYQEPGLVERLMADAASQPGVLPLLQETMVLLWEGMRYRALTLHAYEALGRGGASGLAAALATTADAALAELDSSQQAIARRIFLRLVQLGEGRDDMRRRQPVSALRAAGDDPALFDATLRHLTDRRLLTMSGAARPDAATVDLAHEALIMAWPVLRRWTEEGRTGELFRRQVELDAGEWSRGGRDRSALYRGGRLHAAQEWARRYPYEPSTLVSAFLTASRRRHVALRAVLSLLLLVALVGTARLATPEVQAFLWRREAAALGPMVRLPAGVALLGYGRTGERAQRRVDLAGFAIDLHEVTNRQYRLCVRARVCSPPLESSDAPSYEDVHMELPVVFVAAQQAADYCRWLGRRLPSEAEWERAARGTGGRPWPWGSAKPATWHANLQIGGRLPKGLIRVSDPAFEHGRTPEGIRDLLGNVWEWSSTPEGCRPNAYECQQLWDGRSKVVSLIQLGGGWADPLADRITEEAVGADPTDHDRATGFRCVQSAAS